MKNKSKKKGTNFVSTCTVYEVRGMPVINTHAADIDVGSRSHFVAVGQELSDVREFGVYLYYVRSTSMTKICVIVQHG